MALRETHVEIDFISDTSGLREIQQQTNSVLRETQMLGREFDNNRIRMSELSDESQAMLRAMRTDWRAQRDSMNHYRDDLIKVHYGYHLLTKDADKFSGRTSAYLRQVQRLGAEHKRVTDGMLANDLRRKTQFIQNVGQMMNATSRAKRILDTYKTLGNPIYGLATGTLLVANRLDQIAMAAKPAAIALKMLGPTASMKELQDRTKMIQQGLGGLPIIMLGALFANYLLMTSLHRAATSTIPGYGAAFDTMKEKVRQAFQPMVEVFAMVMVPLYRFITMVAQLVIRFNEAYPTIAKMIQGTILLAVVLTLILAPLSLGIGLVYGMQAAFGYLWLMIKPVVIGLAAMSPIVWAIAAAIVILIATFAHLWKTNEGFRNSIINGWNAIKAAAIAVWGFVKPYIMQALQTVMTFVQTQLALLRTFWQQNGTQIMAVVMATWNVIKTVIMVALNLIVTLFQGAFPIIIAVVQVAWSLIKTVITIATAYIMTVIKVWLAVMRGDWSAAWNAIKQLVMTVWNAIKSFIVTAAQGILTIVISIFSLIRSFVSAVLTGILAIAVSVWNGMKATVSGAMNSIWSTIVSLWNAAKATVSSVLSSMLSAVQSMFNNMVSATTSILSSIRDEIYQAFQAGLDAIFDLGGSFYDAGRGLIEQIINGIGSMAGSIGDKVAEVAGNIRDYLPFSPAKIGPLSDLDRLDFAGPISDSIQKAMPKVGAEMNLMMAQGENLAGMASYSPAQTVSSSRTSNAKTVTFSPVYNIEVKGGEEKTENIKQQLEEYNRDQFATLLDLFGTEVAY